MNKTSKKIMITGGAGFIGSTLIKYLIKNTNYSILNFDKLTYSSSVSSLTKINNNHRYSFIQGDILNSSLVSNTIRQFEPDVIMNLAAETHVDRSIESPTAFIETNIMGTFTLLDQTLDYWYQLSNEKKNNFKFHHISTDEVFGSCDKGEMFTEETSYRPSSPYSASKASADHLVSSWHHTYGFPTILTNCSNNYGPYQFPEKLIPIIILNAINGKELPLYGDGQQVRDWLFVDDHAKALDKVITNGKIGEKYNIGGNNTKTNLEVVLQICNTLDKIYINKPNNIVNFSDLIKFVSDRPGHDKRYAIDTAKIRNELRWQPQETFETGIYKTVNWYVDNLEWCKEILLKSKYDGERLGLKKGKKL